MSNPTVPELPKFSHPLTPEQVSSLNQFVFQLRRLLLGQLTVANTRAQVLDVVIRWPNAEVPRIRTRPLLGVRPIAVELLGARTGEQSTQSTGLASSLTWEWDRGEILLPQFYEPTVSEVWSLRLLVTEAN